MGTKVAPGFANCFMGYFEDKHVYTYITQPLFYIRYLDDIFMIWQHGEEELNKFFNHMNQVMPSIKFTMEKSHESVNFLDTTVLIASDLIQTDLYCKPTDAHNYLLYSSAHPQKCKDSIPYSQFLRIRRICSRIQDYDKHIVEFCGHFHRRGYPTTLLENAALRARRLNRSDLLKPNKKTTTQNDTAILVTTFNPNDNNLRSIVEINWDYLGKSTATAFLPKTHKVS